MKKPIIWTLEQRELVAKRGMELFRTNHASRLESFYQAQAEVLEPEFHRTKSSISKGLNQLEELGTKLVKEAELTHLKEIVDIQTSVPVGVEQTSTISQVADAVVVHFSNTPAPEHSHDFDGDELNRLPVGLVLNRNPSLDVARDETFSQTPTPNNPVITAGINAMAQELARQLATAVGDQMDALEQRYTDTYNRTVERCTRLGNLCNVADRLAEGFEQRLSLMNKRLQQVEESYQSLATKSTDLYNEAQTNLIQMSEVHEQIQKDLASMSMTMEAYAAGVSDPELDTTSVEDTVDDAVVIPKIKRKDRENLIKVMIIGLNGGFQRAIEKEFNGVLDMVFHPADLTKRLVDMSKGADYVICTRWVGHGCYDKVKNHKGILMVQGGITSIKKKMLEIACQD